MHERGAQINAELSRRPSRHRPDRQKHRRASLVLLAALAALARDGVRVIAVEIGAVTAVALASLGCKHVQWSMLGKILVSWILTIPTSAVIAAIILWIFRPAVCASCPWS